MNSTGIEWVDYSWNPIVGCSEMSEGCENCYAKFMSWRVGSIAQDRGDEEIAKKYFRTVTERGKRWTGRIAVFNRRFEEPLRMKNRLRGKGVFVCSMGDLFHHNVDNWIRDWIFEVIQEIPWTTFVILTKRPYALLEYWSDRNQEDRFQNVWFGVTAENQKRADERIPVLQDIPDVAVRFVSAEPLLERVDFSPYMRGRRGIDWIIVGAETGAGARPFDISWGYEILTSARRYRVPFFFKKLRGRGKSSYPPKDLLVRKFPKPREIGGDLWRR